MKSNSTHIAQALALYVFATIFRMLPLDLSSAIGGLIGRSIGRFFRAHKIAESNIEMVMPEIPPQERDIILRKMWDNLGRVIAEYPHLPRHAMSERIEMSESTRKILHDIKTGDSGAIFVSAHLGNWEMAAKVGHDNAIPLSLIYRKANNPYAENYIRRIRLKFCEGLYPKGFRGASQAIKTLRGGGKLAMLVDQKMNDGIAVPFFGRSAMTAPATAELALRYGVPIIMTRVVRRGNSAHFRFEALPPVYAKNSGDRQADILAVMTSINKQLEYWIREHPEQWFWVHRRWG